MPNRRCVTMWFSYGLLLTILNKESLTLRDVRIVVPVAVVRDKNATLRCFYNLEGDQLYSVKWYFRSSEFYRYTPKENPPIKQFQRGDLIVNETVSDNTTVIIEKVSKSLSGQYTCEITTDQPSFFTAMKSAEMTVVDLPKTDPYITDLKTRYRLSEKLRALCVCGGSSPPVNLTWYLNGEPLKEIYSRKHIQMLPKTDLYMVHSTLQLIITKEMQTRHRLKIRCVATLFHLYHKSIENSVELERKRHRNSHHHHHHHHQQHHQNSSLTTLLTSATMATRETPAVRWELAQTAEAYPETTLIFFSPSVSLSLRPTTLHLALILSIIQLLR